MPSLRFFEWNLVLFTVYSNLPIVHHLEPRYQIVLICKRNSRVCSKYTRQDLQYYKMIIYNVSK